MGLGDRAGDVETEAGARLGRGAADAAELLEDQLLVLERDAAAVVDDLDGRVPVDRARAHLDRRPCGRVLDGVVDQVRQHLAEPERIAADAGQVGRHLGGDPDRVAGQLGRRDRLVDSPARSSSAKV